jgi:hypothetical protein
MQSTCRGQTHLVAPIQKGGCMSYESRKKKRQYKRIEVSAKRRRTPESARRWLLTLAKSPGKFECCGNQFERGGEIVYRHEPREVRCVRCADVDPNCRYRPSIRWERTMRTRSSIR